MTTPIKRDDPRLPPLPPLPESAIGWDHWIPFWNTDEDNPADWEMIQSSENLVPFKSHQEHYDLTKKRYDDTGDVRYGRDAFLIKIRNLKHLPVQEWERNCASQATSQQHKGKTVSAETKAKIGAAAKGNTYRRGKTHTEATKALISAANIGNTHSVETKAKMSAAQKGDKNHRFGKTHTKATKLKMSAAQKGENHPMYGKTHSAESKAKTSAAMKAWWAKRRAKENDE